MQGVHAGIRPARADDTRRATEQRARRGEDGALDRRQVGLDLPARVRGAVVRELQSEDAP
jgi:hypothetical protein